MVTPQVQTATSSHRTMSVQSHHSAYERLLAVGLGAALALVAALALMAPGSAVQPSTGGSVATAVQTAHGKATPRTTAAAPAAGGISSVE